ncbi:hypothetical protein Agabi119p4_1370 [Agaricus bisporus var. burnettii]|uniref:Uncharacterized protein n=1 Tax=Agaricus bisporus var. burnettii TaxID=192524 RepID=A0A8H7FCA8_AGABI|nr:hypothetical protein Agabi119p4_1370 [Agaricus bisporus var. burnettii]
MLTSLVTGPTLAPNTCSAGLISPTLPSLPLRKPKRDFVPSTSPEPLFQPDPTSPSAVSTGNPLPTSPSILSTGNPPPTPENVVPSITPPSLSNSSSSEENVPFARNMAAFKLESGISLQPGLLPTLPHTTSNQIDAIFCDDLDVAITSYFNGLSKPVDEKLWFSRSMGIFTACPPLYNWILSQMADLKDKPWSYFMDSLRARYLQSDWHETLRMEMKRHLMDESDNFMIWIESLISLNNRLCGTPSHFLDTEFITSIGSNVCRPLWKTACKETLYDTKKYTTLAAWLTAMNDLEETRLAEIECVDSRILLKTQASAQASTQSSQRSSNRSSSNTSRTPLVPSTIAWVHPYYSTRQAGNCIPVSATARSFFTPGSSIPAPPKLSSEERQILDDNGGCKKCRRVQAGHEIKRCNNDVPSGDGYKPVAYKLTSPSSSTDKSSSTTQPKRSLQSTSSDQSNKKFKSINAVHDTSDDDSDLAVAAYVQDVDTSDESFTIPSFLVSSTSRRPGGKPLESSTFHSASSSSMNDSNLAAPTHADLTLP